MRIIEWRTAHINTDAEPMAVQRRFPTCSFLLPGMRSVQDVARLLPSSRKPVAPVGPSGHQVVNIVEDRVQITTQLASDVPTRFYEKSSGKRTLDMVSRQTPGIVDRYETMMHEDPRYKLNDGTMAFQWLGGDKKSSPYPTVRHVLKAHASRRHGGRTMTMDATDNHIPVQTTLAGLPKLANSDTPGWGDLSPAQKEELNRRLLVERIRLIGRVTAVDSTQAQNARTVAHVAGAIDLRWLYMDDGYPGALIEFVPLTPTERALCALPEDEKDESNPHLVARVVDWAKHDLLHRPSFNTHVVDPLVLAIAAHPETELPDAVFTNQYQKAWYYLLVGMYRARHPDAAIADAHANLIQDAVSNGSIARFAAQTDPQWQHGIACMLMAMREISLHP